MFEKIEFLNLRHFWQTKGMSFLTKGTSLSSRTSTLTAPNSGRLGLNRGLKSVLTKWLVFHRTWPVFELDPKIKTFFFDTWGLKCGFYSVKVFLECFLKSVKGYTMYIAFVITMLYTLPTINIVLYCSIWPGDKIFNTTWPL